MLEELFARDGLLAIRFGEASLKLGQFFRGEPAGIASVSRKAIDICTVCEGGLVENDLAGNDSAVGDAHGWRV